MPRERKKKSVIFVWEKVVGSVWVYNHFSVVAVAVAVVVLHRHNVTTFPASHPGPFVRSLSGTGRRQHQTRCRGGKKSQQKNLVKKNGPTPAKELLTSNLFINGARHIEVKSFWAKEVLNAKKLNFDEWESFTEYFYIRKSVLSVKFFEQINDSFKFKTKWRNKNNIELKKN